MPFSQRVGLSFNESMSGHVPAGVAVAAPVTSVHVGERIDQLLSMQIHDAGDVGEQIAARTAFFSFMNDQLRQVYPELPLLFHGDEQRYLTPSEWRALALIARVM